MNPSKSSLFRVFSSAVVATVAMGMSTPVYAEPIPISQEPLFLSARVKPAFIMALDDSGSMMWETLTNTRDGMFRWARATNNNNTKRSFFREGTTPWRFNEGFGGTNDYLQLFPYPSRNENRLNIPPTPNFGFARSAEFNPAYFDPAVDYLPWKNADGSDYTVIDPTAAPVDPRPAGVNNKLTRVIDLTEPVREDGENGWRFTLRADMILPAGTVVARNGCNSIPGNNQWQTLDTDVEITGNCIVGIEYFPATYYQSSPVSPGYTGTPLEIVNAPGGPINTTLYRFEIKPENYANQADYDAAIQNFAHYFAFYRTRRDGLIASLTNALVDVDFMRIGQFRINQTPTVGMRDLGIAGDRTQLYNDFHRLTASGSTPSRRAVRHAGEQFLRTDPDTPGTAPVQLACQVNAAMLFTDGYINDGTTINVGNLDGPLGAPFADSVSNTMADLVMPYYLNSLRPDIEENRVQVPTGCSAPNPDPRLNCQTNLHMVFYGVTLGTQGEIYGVNLPATEDPFANPPPWANSREDLTPRAVDEIWHATINTRGEFINASNPASLTNAMRDVLNAVLDSSQPSGTLSLTGARIGADTFTVAPSFSVGGNGTDWAGRVQAFEVNPDGSGGAIRWDTNSPGVIPAHGARNILTITQPGSAAITQARLFSNAAGGLPGNEADLRATLGLTTSDFNLDFPAANAAQIVDYIRGNQAGEIDNGGQFRERSTRLGDVVNSAPTIVSPRDDFGYRLLEGTPGETYQAFVNSKAGQPPMVYVGANAGMMHAFNGLTGTEVFAFVPNAMLGNRAFENGVPGQRSIGQLASSRYEHSYYLDGPITVSDAYVGGGWEEILVGAAGAGGKTVFALNVSNPTSGFGVDRVMWEVNQRTDDDIGFVMGQPLILPLAGDRWVALFGNGYNSENERAVLFVVDLETGAVEKIVADPTGTQNNGLGNIIAVDDSGDGLADTIYGGDLQGNVWKFNLGGGGNVANGGLPLFQARDVDGNPQPITGGFDVSAGPGAGRVLYFGTGRYFALNDNVAGDDPQVQTFYAIWDNGSPVTDGRSSLQEQRILSESEPPNPVRQTTQDLVNYSFQRGWYMDLRLDGQPATSERFIGVPRLQSGKVFFTTFQPIGDPCTPGGRNWLYGLDSLTGGAGLNDVSIGSPDADPACVGGSCGALSISEGAPVRDTVLSIPPSPVIPGLNCEIGVDPGCEVPSDLAPLLTRCTLVVSAAGSPPIYLPRPCGRQSWRQIR